MSGAPPAASSPVSHSAAKKQTPQKNARGRLASDEAADLLISARIDEARRALWWGELVRHCLRLVLGIMISIGVWILIDHWLLSRPSLSSMNPWARVVALASLIGGSAVYAWFQVVPLIGKTISPEYAARSLEKNYPSLRQSLTSYITLKENVSHVGLQRRVVQSIGASTAGYLKQHNELPDEATGNMRLWIATAVAMASLFFYAAASPKNSLQSVRRLITPTAAIAPVTRVSIKNVKPGDAEAIAGRSVQVAAEIRGLRSDENAVCEIQYATGAKQTTMQRDESFGSSSYIANITLQSSASGDVPYWINAGDATSPTYQFRVQDVPVVALDSVNYRPPAYTGTGPFTRTSGAITAVEGTAITLNATTNRPIARAAIEFNPKPVGATIQATDGALEMNVGEDGKSLSVDFPLHIDKRRSASVRRDSYRIRVWDEAGAQNPDPIIYPIDIIADLPPEVAIMLPTRVPKDVPIGTQQIIEVHASDADFGLSEIRLQITSGIRNVGEPVLWKDPAGQRGNQVAEFRFRPNELGLSVGDVVRVTAVAIDNKSSEANKKLLGNQSKTDPIELRIVASDQTTSDEDAAGEGLSKPDDKPASDPNSAKESSSEGSGEGEQQQGGGGAEGDQGNSQAGESGQQGSGGGKGDQSEKNEGESQGGEGQSGGEGQNDGDSQGDSSKSGNQGQGQSEPGENQPGEGQPGEGASGENEPMQGQPSEGQAGDGQAGEADAGQGETSRQQNGSQEGAGRNALPNQSGQKENGQSESQQRESPGEDDAPGESGDQSAPKHDGEAFERIQDYLNQKRQEQGQGGQQEGQQGEQSESGEPSQGQSSSKESDGEGSAGKESSQQNDSSQGEPSGSEDSNSQQSKSQQSSSQQSKSQQSKSQQSKSQRSETEQGKSAESSEMADDSSGQPESSQGSEPADSSNQSSGENSKGDSAAGDQNSSEQGDASEENSQQGNESSSSQPDQGSSSQDSFEQDSPKQGASEQNSSDKADGESGEGEPSSESERGGSDQTGSPSGDDSATQSRSPQPSSQGRPGSGDGSGEGAESESSQPTAKTDAANDAYTRKATDMVLDYLDQTRDAPDQELLDRLNWTQQDLKQFQDRWKDIRDLDAVKNTNDPAANRATEEALRSLGLRPPSTGKNRSVREQSDSLKGIRDSGTRRRPPAALRDAFDAFRRQLGNGKSWATESK
jgi:hypothetical protein